MGMPKYAARRDANEQPLIKLAERLGWRLWKLDVPCDWLGCRRGVWHPIEIKSEDGTLTPDQQVFHAEAFRCGATVLVWKTPEDVLAASQARASA